MWSEIELPEWTIAWDEVGRAALILAVALFVAWLVHRLVFALLCRMARLSDTEVDEVILHHLRLPLLLVMIEAAVALAANLDPHVRNGWYAVDAFVIPAVIGLLVLGLVRALAAALDKRTDERVDPIAARSRKTRIALISRTVSVIVVILTIGFVLLGFPAVRDVGTGLLASAGLAALAVGAAAQPALKSLIAGLQMAITEPLRLGDMVRVDGEIGRVEEIKMSYVTVRTWDERVLVVPTSRFLEESFENWSRTSEALTGPVFLHLDPATPVEPIRAEFDRFLTDEPLWDGRKSALLMTEAHPESIELRMTVSAAAIGDLWNLRCAVREHMIGWLQSEMPEALIRHRLEVAAANERASG